MTERTKRSWFQFRLRTLFVVTMACGLWQVFIGLVIVPVLPHVRLDAVLSREELRDDATKKKMLALLQRATANEWLFWTVPGLVVSITSGIGIYSVARCEERDWAADKIPLN